MNLFKQRVCASGLFLAVLLIGPSVHAQRNSAFDGAFTLSSPVNWQGKTLPAGSYTFSLSCATVPAKVIVHGPKGTLILLASGLSDGHTASQSSLRLESFGDARFVRELYLSDLHLVLRYSIPHLSRNEVVTRAEHSEQILVSKKGK